jgi:hypothetical protein
VACQACRGLVASNAREAIKVVICLRGGDMRIVRNGVQTAAGPSEWFTGAVYIDTVATPSIEEM